MKRFLLTLAFALGLLSANVFAQVTFVGEEPGLVTFIQWTDSRGSITGQFQQVSASSDYKVKTYNESFGGTRVGSVISFTSGIPVFGIRTSMTGTIRNSALELSYPSSSGGFVTLKLRTGSIAEYNRLVAALKDRVNVAYQKARTEQLRQEQLAAEQRAVKDSNNQLESALSRVKPLASEITQANVELEKSIASLNRSLEIMRGHVTDFENKAASLTDCENVYDIRVSMLYDIRVSDHYDVETSAQYDVRQAVEEAKTLARQGDDLASRIDQSFAALQVAVKANETGIPKPAFTSKDVLEATKTIRNALNLLTARTKANQARSAEVSDEAAVFVKRVEQAAAAIKCP
jgi:hypothetical protein